MVSDRNLADAVGGKSARACDNCGKKRARWYCAADDAFLCQSCDSSVHSANPLARRHERVRLKTASSNDEPKKNLQISIPTWHQGFTRKPRTPRQKKHGKLTNPLHMVPEMCSEDQSVEENEEQVLVPIFDPFEVPNDFLPLELDLIGEFDVEKFLEDEPFDMEGLGLSDCHGNEKVMKMVKFEDEESGEVAREEGNYQIDIGRETFELNFDYDSTFEEEDEQKGEIMNKCKGDDDCEKRFLKLDYEGVMSAWDGQKSPWTTGERPVLNPGDFWAPDCSGTSGAMHAYGETGTSVRAAMADGGREARVSRYREKRRTRLFSKKIRYEVRKLNAEKRPRMKGRFVKRANFAASSLPVLINK